MINPDHWAPIAAILVPPGIIAVLSLGSPSVEARPQAPAAAETLPVVINAPVKAALTPDQARAQEWLDSLADLAAIRSPMYRPAPPVPDPSVAVAAEPEPEPEPEPIPEPEPAHVAVLAGLRLSGVLGNDAGGLAMVNGRIIKPGEKVRDGLWLVSVNAKTQVAVLRDQNDERYLLIKPRSPRE